MNPSVRSGSWAVVAASAGNFQILRVNGRMVNRVCHACVSAPPSGAGRAKEQDIGTLIKSTVAGCACHDQRLADHGDCVEVEGGEHRARRQLGADEMPLDAAATAIGNLVFGKRSQEAGSKATPDRPRTPLANRIGARTFSEHWHRVAGT